VVSPQEEMTGPTLSSSPKNGRPQVGFVKIVRAARSVSASQGMTTPVSFQSRRNTRSRPCSKTYRSPRTRPPTAMPDLTGNWGNPLPRLFPGTDQRAGSCRTPLDREASCGERCARSTPFRQDNHAGVQTEKWPCFPSTISMLRFTGPSPCAGMSSVTFPGAVTRLQRSV